MLSWSSFPAEPKQHRLGGGHAARRQPLHLRSARCECRPPPGLLALPDWYPNQPASAHQNWVSSACVTDPELCRPIPPPPPLPSHPQNILTTISGEVMRRLTDPETVDSFSRQHLSNLAWSLATLEYNPGRQLLGLMAGALATHAENCLPQEVGNSIWAFGRMQFYHAPLMAAMAEACTSRIEEFAQQNLSNIGAARVEGGEQEAASRRGAGRVWI